MSHGRCFTFVPWFYACRKVWPIGWKNDLWSTISIVWHQNFKNEIFEIQVNSKVFSINSKEFDTHIRSRFAFVFVQMPCRLACYRSFRNQWQHKGMVTFLCRGGSQANFSFVSVRDPQCPGWKQFYTLPHASELWTLHTLGCCTVMSYAFRPRPGYYILVDVYLPLSANTAGWRGMFLVNMYHCTYSLSHTTVLLWLKKNSVLLL